MSTKKHRRIEVVPGEIEDLRAKVDELQKEVDESRGMLWVLARNEGLSLHISKKDLEAIPEGAELFCWYEKLFDSVILKGICSPTGDGKRVKRTVGTSSTIIRPKIVTLCGSTRFTSEMLAEAWRLTITGLIVIHWNILESKESFSHGAERDGVKEIVDDLYLHKIAMADEVRVINVGGYIGDSTRTELRHAQKLGKPITWMESDKVDEEFKG